MSRKTVEIVTCDICGKTNAEDPKISNLAVWVNKYVDDNDGSNLSEPRPLLSYLDLCEDCFNKIISVEDRGFRNEHDYRLIDKTGSNNPSGENNASSTSDTSQPTDTSNPAEEEDK